MKKKLSYTCIACSFCFATFGQSAYQYTVPADLDDGWTTADIRSYLSDTTLLYTIFNQLAEKQHKIHSVVLAKNNYLLLEEYYGNNTTSTPHDLRSATKSILSLLAGIAIDRGFISSVDDPLNRYIKAPVPEKNIDARKEQITLRHLLTMSTGLDCNDWDKSSKGQEDRVYRKKDWLQYTFNLPMVDDPGDTSLYCSMGTVLVAEAISQAAGMPIDLFAQKYLFDPLGIQNVQWGHTTTGREIIASAKRLYMTPRDLAKIGQLVLNEGLWDGHQVVSKAWLQMSTSKQVRLAGINYGFLWWQIPFREGKVISITATGNGGQYLVVMPALNMVMVFTGGAYNSEDDKLPFAIIANAILPGF